MGIQVLIEIIGTLAFALSGIRLSSAKNFDWFGAYIIGFVTAIGGGTVRDLLLNVTPFWMTTPFYLIVTAIALFLFIVFENQLKKLKLTLFFFDAIGLGLFVVVGIEKALENGFPFWVAIILGTITGALGGVIRDVLINETPLIFRKDIYATACVLGGLVYFGAIHLQFPLIITELLAAFTVIFTRIFAMKYSIALPNLGKK